MRICGDQYIGKSELCGAYPPTPADSRGSASEKRGQDGQEANKNVKVEGLQCLALWAAGCRPDPSFAAMVFWRCEGRSCAGRKPAARGHEQVGSWQCGRAGKVKVSDHFRR